jgi:hypothetical protein
MTNQPLATAQAAALADCSPSTVRKCAKLPADNPRHLRGVKPASEWQFTHEDVRDWMERRKAHGPGRPTVGLPRWLAARILKVSRQTVWHHITYGHLPHEMTARDVVEFALVQRSERMQAPTGTTARIFTLHGITRFMVGLRNHGSFDALIEVMEDIAPLTEWRVVKYKQGGQTK